VAPLIVIAPMLLIKMQHFGIQILKIVKGKKIKNKVICIILCFDWCVQFFKLEAYSNASLHP
jgi:hypothetical protein